MTNLLLILDSKTNKPEIVSQTYEPAGIEARIPTV